MDAGLGYNVTIGGIDPSMDLNELASKVCNWQDLCFLRRLRIKEMRVLLQEAMGEVVVSPSRHSVAV